jgi:hypothetical protein
MADNSEINISQSLMKELTDYRLGKSCGLVFVEKYLNKNFELFKPSPVMALGNFFEFLCIGANTKTGAIPQAEKTGKGELTAPYKRMETQSENFKNFIAYHGIEITSVQEKWIVDGLEGTLDFIGLPTRDIKNKAGEVLIKKGQKFICDIKASGLLDESSRFNDFSWNLDTLSSKERLILQPIHYKFLSKLKYGVEYPFMFLIFSNTNDYDYRSIIFNTTEEDMELHKTFIATTAKWLKYFLKKGFEAKPDYLRCMDCPLKVNCKSYMAIPEITVFELNTNAIEK